MADAEAELEAARLRYNELYPDRPIKQVGDTLDPVYYLLTFNGAWLDGGKPLSEQEIAAVEAMTPAGMFS